MSTDVSAYSSTPDPRLVILPLSLPFAHGQSPISFLFASRLLVNANAKTMQVSEDIRRLVIVRRFVHRDRECACFAPGCDVMG